MSGSIHFILVDSVYYLETFYDIYHHHVSEQGLSDVLKLQFNSFCNVVDSLGSSLILFDHFQLRDQFDRILFGRECRRYVYKNLLLLYGESFCT